MIEAALIGAGNRGGLDYAPYALKRPDELKFIAVAEPNEQRRTMFALLHQIPQERQFTSWEQLLDQPRMCQALLICTQDADHYAPTMKALACGYDILLEKPMAPNPHDSLKLAEEADRFGRLLTVCHTMRYSTYFQTLKELVDSGKIGKLMTVQWTENVGYWHQAHSFVRGNWRNSEESSPMIIAKSCHDMDMLNWLVGAECLQVSSFGSLSFFNRENAPAGSTDRCTDGCKVENECLYSAIKWYYNEIDEWPQNVVSRTPTLEARWNALQEGPYGRCVYRCDNNVVDHQIVNLLFDNEVTVNFTMTAFTADNSRTFKLMGTEGEIRGDSEMNEIEINRFSGKREKVYPVQVKGGHGGADTRIMIDFIKQLQNRDIEGKSSGMISAQSHLIGFAAEQSRVLGKTIDMKKYICEIKDKMRQ